MIDIKPNLAEAVAFAVSLPTDQAHLCAIHPAGNRPVVGRSFPKTEAGKAAALRWLTEVDRKGYGIYFNANEVKPLGKGHAKAKETEVSSVRFLHVDADLPAGTAPDDVETARAELLAKIKAAPLVPSLIINSGNGFGLFWELVEPVPVTAENLNDIKACNVALADQLGGDDGQNLDRVMRLPFTVNRPNAKKTKAGRVPVLADIVSDLRNFVVYTLDQFERGAMANEKTATATESSGTAMSETKESKTDKRGRRRGRQPENQKLPAEVAKAGRMLSPERMRIVLNSLTEVPILNHAATKAGIHRKTLEYWLRRSAAGDAGYDIEWQGIEWKFHEHCTSAIDEGNDRLCAAIWQSAMGVVSKTDENGNFILEPCGQPNMKMARHFLEWRLPEKYGERPKRHVPHNTGGVLVIGGDVTKKPEYDMNASVKARKWKSFSRKFQEAKT
jgi:hypothetical protein